MTPERRIMMCRLIEQMEKDKAFAERLGLVNASTYKGKRVDQIKNRKDKGKE